MSGTQQGDYHVEPSRFSFPLDHQLLLYNVAIRNRRYESSQETGST